MDETRATGNSSFYQTIALKQYFVKDDRQGKGVAPASVIVGCNMRAI
jgi:hypothetical protein